MSTLDHIEDKSQCFRYACGLLRQGRAEDAEKAFERCISLSKGEDIEFLKDVYLELSQLRNQQGAYQNATRTFEEFLKIVPGDPNILFAFAQVVRQNATTVEEIGVAESHLRNAIAELEKKSQESLTVRTVKQDLAFILCQLGRDEEAREILSSLGYLYRLSRQVLFYQRGIAEEKNKSIHSDFCAVVDQALPLKMLSSMQQAFSRESVFWSEHNYPRSGYFSYLHSLTETPSTSMDQMLQYLHAITVKHFPHAKNARFAEWWAHIRPHGSGHQMHFDSDDEGRGGVHNPLVSSILYLTEGDVGGPTLVTDQQQQREEYAKKGWLVFPQLNRFAMFQGNLLHCVIPGRIGKDISLPPRGARRATFMVAFWDSVRPQMQLGGAPGASQAFPKNSKAAWPNLFKTMDSCTTTTTVPGACTPVSAVWEDVSLATNQTKSVQLSSLSGIFDYDCGFQGF